MKEPVREFLCLHLAALGAVVEPRGSGLDALLPPEAAAALGIPEEVHLSLDGAPGEGCVDARLGSPVLERAVASRRSGRPVATVALAGELPRPIPEQVPVLLNAVRAGPVGPRTRMPARYLSAHLRLTLLGDELRSALLEVAVRLEDGALVSTLDLTHAYPVSASPLGPAEREAAANAIRAAHMRAAPVALAGALEAIGRRARRDLGRIADYYTALAAEMERAVERARSADERARRSAKRAMLPEELEARRNQLRDRLGARITAELIAAAIVETEVDRYPVPTRRRSHDACVFVQRRAADGALEGPRCAACGLAIVRLFLCDERQHALCEACGRVGRLDAPRCPGCRLRTMPPLVVSVEDATAPLRARRSASYCEEPPLERSGSTN